MVASSYSRRRAAWFQPSPPIVPFKPKRQAPSSALINAILEYADVRHELGGGRVILRLSPRRMKDQIIKENLGREAKRLGEVSVIWDEEEGALIRVLDDGIDEAPTTEFEDPDSELDTFELTEAALAYIARSGSRGGRR